VVKNSIGILDIYGFEIFQVNAFEQLCINYVNEKLQQLFISQTLDSEQQEYRREGIKWQQIEFFNNKIVCDLIEDPKTHGLFPLLDEQCAISRFSELELIERYNKIHGKHPHFIKSRMQGPTFSIHHYAGQVEYDVTLFFEANVDTFFQELVRSLEQSSNEFTKQVFHLTSSSSSKNKKTSTNSNSPTHQTHQKSRGNRGGVHHNGNHQNGHGHHHHARSRRPPSTSHQFRVQVKTLLTNLDHCTPHYIRCLKPNEKKLALAVNQTLLEEQVRYLGLVENLSVRRQGFCYKETYANFLQRYKLLSELTWPTVKSHSTRQGAFEILTAHGIGVKDPVSQKLVPFEEDNPQSLGGFALGKNKIFLKTPQALSSLELLREQKLPKMVQILENAYRKYRIRVNVAKFKAALDELQAAYEAIWRNCLNRRKRCLETATNKSQLQQLYQKWHKLTNKLLFNPSENRFSKHLKAEEETNLIIFTQSFVRAQNARRAFLKLKKAQLIFSKRFRGFAVRNRMPLELWLASKKALLGVRTELERFLGQKKRRRDTLDRVYTRDYIGISQFPALKQLLEKKRQQKQQNKLLFFGTCGENQRTFCASATSFDGNR